MTNTVLEVEDVHKAFGIATPMFKPKQYVHALNGVSLHVKRGETLSLVGESGCGKSTVGRVIMGLLSPTSGQVRFNGERIDNLTPGRLRPLRQRMQIIFQDPFNSLNPRLRVGDAIAEPIRNFFPDLPDAEVRDRVAKLIDRVRLPADAADRWPHEFSGGQRQRICIARALASEPDLIVCDEAVSALDVSIKAQIVNLLQSLQEEFRLALLFISHDLGIVEHMSHRVAVMYLGKIIESGTRSEVFGSPRHPYTRALLSAVPQPVPGQARNRIVLKGDVPSPLRLPSGCSFHTRCPNAFARCSQDHPQLESQGGDHAAACFLNTVGTV